MIKQNKGTGRGRRLLKIAVLLILFVSILGYTSSKWYVDTYGQIGFDSVLYTLTANLDGVEKGLIFNYIKDALVYALGFWLVLAVLLFFPFRKKLMLTLAGKVGIRLYPLKLWVSAVVSMGLSGMFLFYAAGNVELGAFIESIRNPSSFYQEYYVDPNSVQISFPEKKKNLIYIYLESMETTFFSEEQGGALPVNVIPELYQLASENLNFSHNEEVGGLLSTPGTTWTIGAMVGHTSGVPLKLLPGEGENDQGEDGAILPGITALSDILRENGYYQCLMMGSDASFGGRKQYFKGHGVDRICDHSAAIDDGIIPKDYYVWWGMEDEYLFTYARQELEALASQEKPFALSLLTVDTHRLEGYICRLCEDQFDEQYENVNACSSKQVYEFVKWIQEQDFYEDTAVILVGDHLTMARPYVERAVDPDYERHVYNCFMNSFTEAVNTQNRICCTLDMLPTTLAAMGCTIEGERLGLGTNLFSDRPTLIEELGQEYFEQESAAFSKYYMEQFEN